MIKSIRTLLASKCLFYVLLLVMSFLRKENIVLTETISEESGKFMLIRTPDTKNVPDFLVVEKPGGQESLIKVEEKKEKILANRIKTQNGSLL